MENLELVNLTPDKMNVRTQIRLCFLSASGSLVSRSLVWFLTLRLFIEGSEAERRHPDQTLLGQKLLQAVLREPPAWEEVQDQWLQ